MKLSRNALIPDWDTCAEIARYFGFNAYPVDCIDKGTSILSRSLQLRPGAVNSADEKYALGSMGFGQE
jgi:hypothetical protein